MPYQTYYGNYLPDTGSPSNWINGGPGGSLSGTSVNDQIGAGGSGQVIYGGAGDDFYWLKDGSETVVEQPGQGTDTIELWQSYTLPANVENLIVFGNGQTATGNAQDNVIIGQGSQETLYGGYGSDVLVGSPGAGDIYLIKQGEGAKAIQGFSPGPYSSDVIRLDSQSLSTFDQVKAAMTQVGNDVVINDGGEGIVIRNTQTWQFSADDFQLSFNKAALGAPVFDDEFNSLTYSDPSKGLGGSSGWWPSFGGSAQGNINDYTLTRNGEQQIYTSPYFTGSGSSSVGLNPFSVNNGVLSIAATQVNWQQSQQMWGYQYSSGALTTEWSHEQTYGYFEMRAQLPTGQGTWPAFWLVGGGTELDVMEAVGNAPNEAYVGYHSPAGGDHTVATYAAPTADGYHTYGLLWTPTDLVYYVDGMEVLDTPTPSDMHQSMYMIVNMAIGGGWAGSPDGSTAWPQQMNIDYVRAYALPGVTIGGGSQGGGSQGSSTQGSSPQGGDSQTGSQTQTGGGSQTGSAPSGGGSEVWITDASYTAPGGVTSIHLGGSGETVTGNDAGDTFYSNDTANHLIGGAGNDVFHIGRGGDTVTGGSGADDFIFDQNPWNGGHITDFTSIDKIDIGPTLDKAGYHGSDPVNAGFLRIDSDAQGNARLWIDPNGSWGSANGWWLATTLDGVSASSLHVGGGTITTDGSGASAPVQGGGSTTPPPATGGASAVWVSDSSYFAPSGVTSINLTGHSQTVTGNDAGDTFYSNDTTNRLIGGAGADVFHIGRAGDIVTGGGGADDFVFDQNPWNAGHITDFTGQDQIDITPTLQKAGYTGSDPLGAGYAWIDSDSQGNARLWIDPNGTWGQANGWWLATTVDGVAPYQLHEHGGLFTL